MTQSWTGAESDLGERGVGMGVGGTQAVETPVSVVEAWWRHAGVLDRLRLRRLPIVARATVQSEKPLEVGLLVVLCIGGERELWARVLASTLNARGGHTCALGLLGVR